MPLHTLPYDLLFNISQYLDIRDVYALQLTSKSLHDFTNTRPVYRDIANILLSRSRPLPLKGFQKLSDLPTQQLIQSVNRAYRFERAWRVRAPHPITVPSNQKWYKVIRAPPGEEVDWLSPITSSYTLCATKSGKVVCWDVQRDVCLAEWNPGEKWELWKCRVEFEERTVYFTMAKLISGSYDDGRIMEFILMSLHFPEDPVTLSTTNPSHSAPPPSAPVFSYLSAFPTTGVVMNVFLLDPPNRLLSAFVWVSASNTIGLYVLLDWAKDEYVFVDTGVVCLISSNWSCILHENQIVIHCEESDAAYQHFYPLELLQTLVKPYGELGESAASACSRCGINVSGGGESRDNELHDGAQDDARDHWNKSKQSANPRIPPRRRAPPSIATRLLPERTVKRKFRFPGGGGHGHAEQHGHLPHGVLVPGHQHEYIMSDLIAPHATTFQQDEFTLLHPGQSDHIADANIIGYPGQQHDEVEFVAEDPQGGYENIVDGHNLDVRGEESLFGQDGTDLDVPGGGEESEEDEVQEAVFDSSFQSIEGGGEGVTGRGGWVGEAREDHDGSDEDHHPAANGSSREDREQGADMTDMSPSSVQIPIHHHTHEEQQHQHEFQFGNVGPINLTDNEIYQHIQLQLAGLTPSDPTQNVYQHETPPFASTSTQTSDTASSNSNTQTLEAPSELNPNPYPFPPYYPESAHFVRQWWPTLPGVRRMSCTVVLLAAHNPINHRTRFVLAQHYFGVPVTGQSVGGEQEGSTGESGVHEHREGNEEDDMLKLWYVSTPFEVVCVLDRTEENGTSEGKNDETAAPAQDGLAQNGAFDITNGDQLEGKAKNGAGTQTAGDGITADGGDDDDESDIHGVNERPRPLVAVDFGHAVWVEHCGERHACGQREFCGAKVGEETGCEDSEDGELDIQASINMVVEKRSGKPNGKGKERVGAKKGKGKKKQTKCLRFVTFPAVGSAKESAYRAKRDRGLSSTTPSTSTHRRGSQDSASTGVVRTLDIPDELDLDSVETINIDQSQGAVILSVREGKIFILMYE